jgi:N-acetylmuramoyl-L-alanine amidase
VIIGLFLVAAGAPAEGRDAAVGAQQKCRGRRACKALQPHLKRLRRAIRRGDEKARFVIGSVQGREALRRGDKALALRAGQTLKAYVVAEPSSRLSDDALVLLAQLRRLRGQKARAAKTLQHSVCAHPKGDQRRLARRLYRGWTGRRMPRCGAPTKPAPLPPKAAKKSKPVALSPQPKVAQMGDGGGALQPAVTKIRKIVLDPGHGGADPGAVGRHGVHEADLAYQLTVDLADVLRGQGFAVQLTRGRAAGLSLKQRTAFANAQKADLFVSVHLNSARNRKAHGFETYYLNTGADRYAVRLAARENKQSEAQVDALGFILADLATKRNTADSRRLAKAIQSSLDGVRTNRKKPIQSALFYVLLGAEMPAVLVEAGFVTHADDVKRLRDTKRRRKTAEIIARGIKNFAAEVARGR